MGETDRGEIQPREAFENQVEIALSASMDATYALWEIKRSLDVENAGGTVDWDRIEENVWMANECIGLAEMYVSDGRGIVAAFERMDIDGGWDE